MKATVESNTILLEGVLDEATVVADLRDNFAKLKASAGSKPMTIDFSKVSYANSIGILTWIRFMMEAKTAFKYVNAPVWLVTQFNSMQGFLENGSYVESFQAPYYGTTTGEALMLPLTVGKDIPILQNYSTYSFENKIVDGKDYEIDFDPNRYLLFITRNFESFKKAIAAA